MFGVKLRPFSILVTDFFGEKKAAFCFINADFCLLNEAYLSVYLSGFETFHICPNTWQDLKK